MRIWNEQDMSMKKNKSKVADLLETYHQTDNNTKWKVLQKQLGSNFEKFLRFEGNTEIEKEFYAGAAHEYYDDLLEAMPATFDEVKILMQDLENQKEKLSQAVKDLPVEWPKTDYSHLEINRLEKWHPERFTDPVKLFEKANATLPAFVERCGVIKDRFQKRLTDAIFHGRISTKVEFLPNDHAKLKRKGLMYFRGTKKARHRIVDKGFGRDGKNRVGDIKDALRASFGFDTYSDLLLCLEELYEDYDDKTDIYRVVRIKIRFRGKNKNPNTLDVLVNIEVNGLLCEIQLHVKRIYKLLDHGLYVKARSLD